LSESRGTTVDVLVQMGAIEARPSYLPLACSSMYAYCTTLMHMSEHTAYKRIRTARVARKFPAILPMISEGKLHLAAVVLLAPYLTHGNVTALLADATYKSKAEVQLLLAHRFPKPDVATVVRPLPEPSAGVFSAAQVVANITQQLSPGTVVPTGADEMANLMGPLVSNADSRGLLEVVTQGAVRDEDHVLYPPERLLGPGARPPHPVRARG
jgi:hypothetical protein